MLALFGGLSHLLKRGNEMLSSTNRSKLNNDNPTSQGVKLGDALALCNTVVRINMNSDAKTAPFTFTMPVSMYIADVVVQAQATKTDGTLTLKRSTTAITNAIVCAADHAVVKASTIDNAQATTTAGETLNFVAAGTGVGVGEAVAAIVYIYGSPV